MTITPAKDRCRGQSRSTFQKVSAVTFLIVIHAAPVAALMTGYSISWTTFAGIYLFLALGVGIGLHRYFAHHAFQTSRVFQAILGIWSTTTFTDPLAFAGKHRLHHKYSDKDGDPHRPKQGFWQCWFGSLVDEGYSDEEIVAMVRDLSKVPELMLLHRFYWIPGVILGAGFYLIGGAPLLALGYCGALALLVNLTSSVNYFCHFWGARPYATKDGSRNNPIIALLTFGEGWHNNHHYYPGAARAGFSWWQLDLLYWCIRLLAMVGIVWGVRECPLRVLEARRHGA